MIGQPVDVLRQRAAAENRQLSRHRALRLVRYGVNRIEELRQCRAEVRFAQFGVERLQLQVRLLFHLDARPLAGGAAQPLFEKPIDFLDDRRDFNAQTQQ